MKKITKFAAPLFALSLFAAGCQSNEGATDPTTDEGNTEDVAEVDTINVQATIFPIVDFTERIGGDFVEVSSIFAIGANAHDFEPTQQQIVDIARADLFIFNGAGMEPFTDTLKETLADEDVMFVEAAEGVELDEASEDHDHAHAHGSDDHSHDHDHDTDGHEHGEEDSHDHGHSHGDYDPHIWLDPMRAITMAENILNALVEQQPENEEYFQSNFEELKSDLEELDGAFQAVLDESELNKVLVSHAAYGYWERYGLEQLAVAGLSATDEPSQQELATIIQTARDNNITTILFETTSSPNVANVVRNELDLNVLYLNHLATITQEDYDEGRSYFDLMNGNIEVLREALNP